MGKKICNDRKIEILELLGIPLYLEKSGRKDPNTYVIGLKAIRREIAHVMGGCSRMDKVERAKLPQFCIEVVNDQNHAALI